jgi:hypothetical protein
MMPVKKESNEEVPVEMDKIVGINYLWSCHRSNQLREQHRRAARGLWQLACPRITAQSREFQASRTRCCRFKNTVCVWVEPVLNNVPSHNDACSVTLQAAF